jgi:uncharacterized protein (DUF58 family)
MKKKNYLADLFFSSTFFILWSILALLFIASFFATGIHFLVQFYFWILLAFCIFDYALLFFTKHTITAIRLHETRMSNGDDNIIEIELQSTFRISLNTYLIDELPAQFQKRDFWVPMVLKPNEKKKYQYKLTPTERGEYDFGDIHVYVSSLLNLVQRRCTSYQQRVVKVYPSFMQLKKINLQIPTSSNATIGNQKMNKKGVSAEFDFIKEYNRGDDARTINWKASARRNSLMVNAFMDEKSKQVYCIIDKGRLMKMPFNGLTLLDYAINASLMFSYTALHKQDKVGLVTFASKVDDFLGASKNKKHFNAINEALYKQETNFLESNYAALYHMINQRAGQRSLLMLFTNFETFHGFERQLPFMRLLNQKHLLCVVMFENTELKKIHENKGDTLEDIYTKTIADKFHFEKKCIIKEMRKNGILVVFTPPERLNFQVVNKYLEIKRRQGI